MKALMCVPNISEGTDLAVVEKVVDAIRSAPGVMLLDYSSNADHNRSVITYIGTPEAVVAATKDLTKTALGLIDMTRQKGSHPRQGAVDVVPFIPIRGISEEEAVTIAREFGRYVGEELDVPVYFYEDLLCQILHICFTDQTGKISPYFLLILLIYLLELKLAGGHLSALRCEETLITLTTG